MIQQNSIKLKPKISHICIFYIYLKLQLHYYSQKDELNLYLLIKHNVKKFNFEKKCLVAIRIIVNICQSIIRTRPTFSVCKMQSNSAFEDLVKKLTKICSLRYRKYNTKSIEHNHTNPNCSFVFTLHGEFSAPSWGFN